MSRLKSDHENVCQTIRDMFHSQIETLLNEQKQSKFPFVAIQLLVHFLYIMISKTIWILAEYIVHSICFRNYEKMLTKVDELTGKISEVTRNVNKQTDKSSSDQTHYISFREQQLEIREERLENKKKMIFK